MEAQEVPVAVVRRVVPVDDDVALSIIEQNPDGPLTPVLLVHGLASNARMWDGVAQELAALGHPVIAVDQRGHGLSSKPDGGYDFATVDRDLYRLITQVGWLDRRPMVAGQSWGGNVVLDLAVRYPDAVGALALVDGGTIEFSTRFADWPTASAALAPPPLAGTPLPQIEGWMRNAHEDWPEPGIQGSLANLEVLPDGTVRPWLSRENHMKILRSLWEHKPRDLYARVSVPTLLIMASDASNQRWMSGKRDEVETAVSLLPVSDLHWIDGDHDLHAQHPALVASLIHTATP
jgi:pimeloyl-ACP methyl ester carboxylesterase